LKEESFVELQAVGAGAVNQAVKAIAIARGYIAPNGINIIMIPAFVEIDIDGDERTAIRFIVEPR
jgi:stage V sporulation protein S